MLESCGRCFPTTSTGDEKDIFFEDMWGTERIENEEMITSATWPNRKYCHMAEVVIASGSNWNLVVITMECRGMPKEFVSIMKRTVA